MPGYHAVQLPQARSQAVSALPENPLVAAIQCVRGARSTRGRAVKASFSPVDLVSAEANFRPC